MSGQTEQEPSIEEILASIRQIISDDDEDTPDTAAAEPEEASSAKAPEEEKAPKPDVKPELQPEPASEADNDVLELKDPLPAPKSPPVIDLEDALDDEDEKDFISALGEDDGERDMTVTGQDEAEPEAGTDLEAGPEAEPETKTDAVIDPMEQEPAAKPEAGSPEGRHTDQEMQPLRMDEGSILGEAARSAALSGFSRLANTMPLESGTTPRTAQDGLTLEDILRDMLNPLLRSWLDENLPHIIETLVQKELDKLARRASDD